MIRHAVDYFLLLIIISFGLGGLFYFRFDFAAQVAAISIMAIFYVLWGVLHHFHDKNLSGKVVMEYVAMSALASFILIIFLLRA